MARPSHPKPAIPDLRFEASYRRAIAPANGSWPWIIVITLRDQLFFPFAQGLLWTLIVTGYRSWRVGAQSSGFRWGEYFRQVFGKPRYS